MAVLSDYLSGTITVTNGSTAFTGTGTAWRVVGFREGDTVQLQGFTAIIAGTSAADPLIESNTAGHFTEPWAGASGTYAYRMRYLPDGARVTAQTRALIELLGNGVLYSIAELPVEEGKLLIGNASGQYVLIDRSELGIDDPHANLSQLAAIAKANDQFVIMGSDGTIALKSIKSVTDAIAENATEIDKKYALPVGGTAEQLIDATGAAITKAGLPISLATQLAIDELQSYGTNANGEFWRFKSGLQITARISGTYTIALPAGNIFVNGAAQAPYNLAAAFIAEPYEIITSHNFSGIGHSWAASVTRPSATQSSSVQLFRATSDSGSFFFRLVHIGRWK